MMPNREQIRSSAKAANAAEDILKNLLGGKDSNTPQLPSMSKPLSDNLSRIKVPDSLVESITGIKPTEPKKVINEETVKARVEDLVTRLSSLLKEAKSVLEEMTTTGMIGVGKVPVLGQSAKFSKKKKK